MEKSINAEVAELKKEVVSLRRKISNTASGKRKITITIRPNEILNHALKLCGGKTKRA